MRSVPVNVKRENMDVVTDSKNVFGTRPEHVFTALSAYEGTHHDPHKLWRERFPDESISVVRPTRGVRLPFEIMEREGELATCGDILYIEHPPQQWRPQLVNFSERNGSDSLPSPILSSSFQNVIVFNETLAATLGVPSDQSTLRRPRLSTIKLYRLSDSKVLATTAIRKPTAGNFGSHDLIMTRFNLIVKQAICSKRLWYNLHVYSLPDLTHLYAFPLPFHDIGFRPLNTGNIALTSWRHLSYTDVNTPITIGQPGPPAYGVLGARLGMFDAMRREFRISKLLDPKRGNTVLQVREWEVDAQGQRTGRPGVDRFVWWEEGSCEEKMEEGKFWEKFLGTANEWD
ncbi:hypothetical protein HDV00_012177 [Rhizophlyctis rosea]|nr:hypothetical protein HDV00_012177 [Rhizophlyctis rosea]